MASTLYYAPTVNYKQTTLNGAITSSQTTITLNSTTNLSAPGYVVIDRVDASGNSTPNSREVVSYTGISGNDLTGCTRGTDGSTNVAHNDGAVVETMPTIGMWNSLTTIVGTAIDGSGYLKAIASPVSVARLEGNQLALNSVASIAAVQVGTRLDVSGASVTGIGLHPVFTLMGLVSGPTTLGNPLVMPQGGTFQFFTAVTRSVASAASVVLDIKKNLSLIHI